MMTSSGSGAYRVGGSLSSSNLSPLAPPFKVDKSLSKQNSTNPSLNFVDGSVYGSCFDPAPGQFWSSSTSSTSGLQCVADESVVMNTNCSSSPNIYRYGDSQSSTSQAGMYYGSSNGVAPFDPFSYDPFPNSMPSTAKEAENSYFVPYVPPPSQKDGYDLLSYSSSTHMSGCVPAQVDHAQALPSDGEYKSKWGSFWSAFGESEHGKWTDYVQGCGSKDLNASNISSNKSPIFVDGTNKSQPFVDINVPPIVDRSSITHPFDDASNPRHLKKGAFLTQDFGLHGQSSTIKDNCFNIFGGACSLGSLGIENQNFKSLPEFSEKKTSASLSIFKETPRIQEPVLESISSFCGPQKANVSSPDSHFREPGYFMFGCASSNNTFPKSLSELPYISTFSAVKQNSMANYDADQSNTTGGYNFTYQMEGQNQIPLGPKRHSSIRIRKPVSSFNPGSSCQTEASDNSRLADKFFSEQMKISSQPPNQLTFDGSNMEGSNVEVYSVEKHSTGSDGHNPAEDSPCWKGASSQRFSPFGLSESVDSDDLVKKVDSCNNLSSQDFPNSSVLSNTFGSKEISSGKVDETTSFEKSPINDSPLNGNEDCGSLNPKFCHFDLNTEDGLQFTEDFHASMAECNMINKSKEDLSKAFPSEECGNTNPVEEKSGLALNNDNNLSNLLVGNKACLKSASEDSNMRIDINMMLRTMMNMSETFRSYCFKNRAEVSEKQALVIKQILCNLNASMLMISGQKNATNVVTPPDKFFLKEFPVVQMVNDAEVLAASLKLGGTTEDFSNFISSKDDGNSFEDANMKEAVKKLISEDFQEDMDKQKLLYKNLWLEAESSLCVMTAKARFLRMKTEMKRIHDGCKDKDNSTSSNVHVDLHKDIEYPTTTISPITSFLDPKSQMGRVDLAESERPTSTKNETSFSSLNKENSCSTSHANDVDTSSVMARYQILKNRVGCPDSLNCETNLPSSEHKCPSSELDVGTNVEANDLETRVFGGYQILKGRDDNVGCPNYEDQQLPGEENYLPENEFSNDKGLEDSQMSNSLGVTSDGEASVMARFKLIQSRINHLNFDIGGNELAFDPIMMNANVKKTSFGPYPQLTEDENVDNFDIAVNEQAFDPIVKNNRMSSVILEGWYDNECSSSDWEHISSRDV